ncbi:Uncharacterised protein [Yersinia intermedia]|nr:Uncharacterised protein [Yersinia intermedia]
MTTAQLSYSTVCRPEPISSSPRQPDVGNPRQLLATSFHEKGAFNAPSTLLFYSVFA